MEKAGQRGIEPIGNLFGRRDVHRRRKRVVRGLAEVDVVVGVDRLLAAERAAEDLAGAVRDHLVHVHVGLGAGPGLPDHQGKMTIKLPVHDLVGRRGDRLGRSLVETAKLQIGQRRRFLHQRHGADQRPGHVLVADLEVLPRAFGLGAPIAVAGHLDRAESVPFGAGCGGGLGAVS